jgi:hypothetical protein
MVAVPLSVGSAAADIYRFVDKDGVIHYTDDLAKVPPEYESVVEHRSVTRSPAAASDSSGPMVLTPRKGTDQPAAEQTEEDAAEAPDEIEQPSETEESGAEIEEGESAGEGESGEPSESPEDGGQEGEGSPERSEESTSAADVPVDALAAVAGSGSKGPENPASQRSLLIDEQNTLLRRQAEMNSDTSYQKRKLKRKYQGRPYMKKLMDEELQIEARLKEIETALR